MAPRRKQRIRLNLVSLVLLTTVLTQVGCKVDNQKAEDNFVSGVLPKTLFKLANQQYALKHYQKLILQGIEKEKQSPSLPFLVMDNGLDIAHPDLINDILFQQDDKGHFTAGFDPMGGDMIASSVLIDPKLYSFVADGIVDGKISGPDVNPLEVILSLHAQFYKELKQAIHADPVLSKSLYTKITKTSFSIFGAHRLLTESKFDSKTYESLKKKNLLLSSDMRSRKKEDIEGKIPTPLVHYTLDTDWDMSRTAGLPKLQGSAYASDIWKIQHADRFNEVLQDVMAKYLSSSSKYAQGIENMLEFGEGRIFDGNQKKSKKLETVLDILNEALYFKLHSYRSFDPIHNFNDRVRELYLAMIPKGEDAWRAPIKIGAREMEAGLETAILKFQQFLKKYNELEELSTDEKFAGRELQKNMTTLLSLVGYYLEERQWGENSLLERESYTPQSSQYRNHLIKTNHPLLSSKSATVTHGTHVAETAASGHGGQVKVVPARVTTQGIAVDKRAKAKLKDQFFNDFSKWLENPLVYTAVVSKYNSVMGKFENSGPHISTAEKRSTIQEVLRVLDRAMSASFEESVLDYNFFNEIISTIKFTGRNKIPVGNISLGTNFEKAPASVGSSTNPEIAASQLFEFLRFEYFKYKIGETVVNEAPGTLFHVASGNDGKWIDGESRSALPVDVSSPFLSTFETKDLKAPNNHLDNILAVGSIDPRDKISSFTNIPISASTPFVLAHGEKVLSAIKTTDLTSISQVLSAEMPFLRALDKIDILSELIVPIARELFLSQEEVDAEATDEDKKMLNDIYVKRRLGAVINVFTSLRSAVAVHLFLKYPNFRATLTGTSMATPTVLNITLSMIIKKAEAQGLALNEVYNKPGFRPADLVEDIFNKVAPINPGSKGVQLQKLIGEFNVPVDKDVQGLEKLLRSMKGRTDPRLVFSSNCAESLLKVKK